MYVDITVCYLTSPVLVWLESEFFKISKTNTTEE